MKIGFIAMSGIRVEDPELLALGLSMPSVVDRVQTLAAMPSLSLLTLAALTPDDIEIEYREVVEIEDADELPEYDMVAISTLTAQASRAYGMADRFRARGSLVVMGGLHVTAQPKEAMAHCHAIVVGEAETVWPRVVEDARRGQLERIYRPEGEFDLANAPMPRYDLLNIDLYNRLPVQTCRGCPHRCDFCASSILITEGYKLKPIERVIAEIRRIKELWPRPFIEFADDNSFCSAGHSKNLLRALKAEKIRWFTETDIGIAEDPELLDLMREAGCRAVLVGLESPTEEGLAGLETRSNWKLRQFCKYEQAVRTIQNHGIAVNGCFVLGRDTDTAATFDAVYDFVERVEPYDVQVTVLTPLPGTPVYEKLKHEGRLLQPGNWDSCTLFDVNYHPTNMSAAELRDRFKGLVARVYEPTFVAQRREKFWDNIQRLGHRQERADRIAMTGQRAGTPRSVAM